MKTRYTILEPVAEAEPGALTVNPRDLETLTWVDCEFKGDAPTLEELSWLLDPLFPDATYWERVAVNSFKGPTDMFVDEHGAGAYGSPVLPINGIATLVYWTATQLHRLAPGGCDPLQYNGIRLRALIAAADMFLLKPDMTPPRIHGRAVLFEDAVWH